MFGGTLNEVFYAPAHVSGHNIGFEHFVDEASGESSAWELTTLSFVIDWFLPIGNFLAGLTAPLGTTFARGFVDKVFEADIMSAYVRGGIDNLFKGSPEHASWKYFGFEREVLSVVPDARLVFGTGLSSINRALSAVALLRQRS